VEQRGVLRRGARAVELHAHAPVGLGADACRDVDPAAPTANHPAGAILDIDLDTLVLHAPKAALDERSKTDGMATGVPGATW